MILYEQVTQAALGERQAVMMGLAMGSEGEVPTVQEAIDQLDAALVEPLRPSQEDVEKVRLRQAIGLAATPWGR